MPGKNSKECFDFPQRLFSMNKSVFPVLRCGEIEENRLKNYTSQNKLPAQPIAGRLIRPSPYPYVI